MKTPRLVRGVFFVPDNLLLQEHGLLAMAILKTLSPASCAPEGIHSSRRFCSI